MDGRSKESAPTTKTGAGLDGDLAAVTVANQNRISKRKKTINSCDLKKKTPKKEEIY